MSVKVNPPPQLRIPDGVSSQMRTFLDRQQYIIFQLWNRTGGNRDAVAGQLIVSVTSTDTVIDQTGTFILSDASLEQIDLTLPKITQNISGEPIQIAVYDDTNPTTITASGTDQIVTADGLVNTVQLDSIGDVLLLRAITTSLWMVA